MTEHVLKTLGTAWDAIKAGEKGFEVRKNDRFFQRGDVVVLRKLHEDGRHYATDPTSPSRFATLDLKFKIGWMLQGGQFGIESGYVVFQLEPLTPVGGAS
jgi:hypothetical protein